MNKRYEVLWSNVAENDLIGIIEYIVPIARPAP
jgi:plasmid stabilization system protein ParE